MILIRLILLAVIVWIALRIHRILQRAQAEKPENTAEGEVMVRCEACGVHVPRRQALAHGQQWFCCAEHRREYLGHGD